MKKSLLNLLGVAVISYSFHAYAAGVGGVNVESSLGQPLNAQIELLSVDNAEKASLVARLASVDAYESRGLDYPFDNKFKFTIENHADGTASIRVTSSQAINEPFVSLLVDVNWASGKLLREFTFLLNSVSDTTHSFPAPNVQPVAPIAAGVAPQPLSEESAPAPVVEKPAPKMIAKPFAAEKSASSDSIKVQSGDSLNKLAQQNAVEGVSLERMIVALYRANAKQFDGKNMNRIKTGKILRMPDEQDLAAISDPEAKKEIRVQVQNWNAYRQQLASALPRHAGQATTGQVSTGKISSSVVDSTPVAKESAKEVLKLSKGIAPTEKVVSAGKGNVAQEQKNAAQEDAIAQAKAAEEERKRVAMLESNLQEIKRLAELKSQSAALLSAASAVAAPVESAVPVVSAVSAVTATSDVVAASVVPPVSAVQATPQPAAKSSLVERLLAKPIYLLGGLFALMGLAGLAVVLRRRKAAATSTPAAVSTESNDAVAEEPVALDTLPASDNVVATQVEPNDRPASLSADDPISEADLFLSFGRDAQAEDILKEALLADPSNDLVKLKLLEIYAKNQNKPAFEKIARELKASGSGDTWSRARSMGQKLDPTNRLYDEGFADVDTANSLNDQAAFDANALDAADSDANEVHAAMDLDVGTESSSAAMSNELTDSAADTAADNATLDAHAADAASGDEMDFSLDFPVEAEAAPASKPAEFDFSSINLDLNDAPVANAATAEDFSEVETKLDLAKAYQEMGDSVGAREILAEVLRDGSAEQREAAETILSQLS